VNVERQLKTKLSALSKTQEVDQKILENINKIISDATNVISKYLVSLWNVVPTLTSNER
jgi:hypothetical protein